MLRLLVDGVPSFPAPNSVTPCRLGYHLKAYPWEGPNWFLYNNQYVNTNAVTVPVFTDSANLWAHITP